MFVKSINTKQLKGKEISENDAKDCKPIKYNKDLKFTTKSVTGVELDPDGIAHPCGIAARLYFNDTFSIINIISGEEVKIEHDDIAWSSDIEHRYQNVNLDK